MSVGVGDIPKIIEGRTVISIFTLKLLSLNKCAHVIQLKWHPLFQFYDSIIPSDYFNCVLNFSNLEKIIYALGAWICLLKIK